MASKNGKTSAKKNAGKTPAKKAAQAKAPAAEKTAKPAKAPKEPKAPREKIEANGQVRPGAGTKTGSVWDQADKITAKQGSTCTRAQIMEWAASQNPPLAAGMVATQYGRWRRFIGQPGRLAKPETEAKPKGKGKKAADAAA